MSQGWPDSHKQKTIEVLEYLPLSFFAHELSCLLKHIDGRVGKISLENAFSCRWLIQLLDSPDKIEFQSLQEMIESGWSLSDTQLN